MRYSYGDSSESPFTSNFLEFLRDAIDFAVFVLEADRRIAATRQRVAEQKRRTELGLAEIESLRRAVAAAIEATPKEAADPIVHECAARMAVVSGEVAAISSVSLQQRIEEESARAEADEVGERRECEGALLALLAQHVPPASTSVSRLVQHEAGGYEARREGVWPGIGLAYQCQLSIPNDHPFSHLLRVEALQHRLEIGAPEETGWLRKEVKVRPQHLERHVITEAVVDGSKVELRLRTEPGSDVGFDLSCDLEADSIAASRVVAEQDRLGAGPFDVRDEDAPKLMGLCRSVHSSLVELRTTRLLEATLGDSDFRALPKFYEIAERIVGYLSPYVHEVAKHSLEPDELVLRRQLADDRREEIFVSKATLRQKYEHLAPDLAALFASLALHTPLSRSLVPGAGAESRPVTRSELPPSNPPPAEAHAPVAVAPLPAPPSFDEREVGSVLEKIAELQKAGREEDAFRECAALLERSRFSAYSQGEQREALKMLLLLNGPAGGSYVTRRAHRAGRDRARALVKQFGDPADYEVLGMCQAALGELAEALESFRRGLELEHGRNPRSDLCARLAQHTSKAVASAEAPAS